MLRVVNIGSTLSRNCSTSSQSPVPSSRGERSEIDTYLATRTWQGCSGAYAIQEENDPYVRLLSGSISNVIGLPMETLTRVLATV